VTPNMSWIQKFHCQLRSRRFISGGQGWILRIDLQRSIGPPMTPPILVPIVEDNTMKHNGQCWVSGSYMSAIRPKVTLPPAVERPPWHRQCCVSPTLLGKTYKSSANHDRPEVWGDRTRDLPDVDEQHTQLQNRPTAELFAPRCPQLASEGVEDEIDHLPDSGSLLTDSEMLRKWIDSAWIHRCVEVHRDLNSSDGRQIHGFLPFRPRVCELVPCFPLLQLALAVGASRVRGMRFTPGIDG